MPTYPGVNNSFALSAFPLAERQIIMRLAQHFYITRAAEPTQIGNSSYRAFLMRPSEGISAALNVEREIAVLFADYETFEARTLRAFDLTCDQFDDVRVDRSLRFLISRDQNIESSIRHYLLQDLEYPIVIPYRYDDFRSATEDFIFNAIRRNYLIRDLFGYQSPLKHEYFFFGRKAIVEDVLDLHKSGQNSALFGLRKSGKTSTIHAIQRRAKTAGCQTIVVDCQDPAIHAKRYGPLLEQIITEVRQELNLKKIEVSLGSSPDQISAGFQRHLNDALNAAGSDVLLIFDEIENISPRTAASAHWRTEEDALLFWQITRSFFQNAKKRKMTFCFVGTNPHLFELAQLNGIANPVYLFAPKTFIPMLTQADTKEMITRLGYFMGLDFDAGVVAHIYQRFGGHPFFTRQLCSHIHRRTQPNRPRTVSIAACNEAERGAVSDLQNYMKEILSNLNSFYPDEYSMLEYLARGETSTFKEMVDYSPEYVEHLIGYGLVIRRGDDYEFAFDAIAEAVKRSLKDTGEATREQKWANISKRRNNLEQEIRGALYRWSDTLEPDEWKLSVEACLSKPRLAQLGVLSRRQAFSRNSSPLYLIELLKFIQQSKQSRASQISEALNVVNNHRVDAHAKDIEETEYQRLNDALAFLEDVFLPPP
ncbi:ATP-binding protein [Bradyrhizobium sp. CW4]|uniref:AAA family ATPase n=1 Tax=Bradyrhizobium sp. CW4 TaxID=2782687 RepID=UPI001FFAE29F|nr:ATP-binding protein [Bradyrhizobium sp. CW4]MCK1417626.1 ATP-binding protein [Bradyrhizobium sp. CW4]